MLRYEGRNRRTVNFLKTMYFDYPDWVPCRVGLMLATWTKYREDLEGVVLAHPRLFPGYEKGSKDFDHVENPLYQAGLHTDCWGTVWRNIAPGMDSHPVGFPLADWSALDTYEPPDPLTQDLFGPRPPWEEVRDRLKRARESGGIATGGGLWHGFMYMRLFYLRGFENLMLDMAVDEPRLNTLIRMVENHNTTVINQYLDAGAEMMHFGDDLGLQDILPMGPGLWRKFIKPSYDRMFARCRAQDVPIYLHTDGHVLEVIPDLIEVGVRILNPQIRANGLEGLKRMAKGKVCIDQDLDRQLWPFATPSQIEDHIRTVFEGLYDPAGGLMLFAECEPDVPLANIDTICTALEAVCNPPQPGE